MINFSFDNIKKEPLYINIYKQIKKAIMENVLKPNQPLESKRKLSSRLNVSVNTIMQAYNLLLDEGLIISIPQKGYYVIDYEISNKKEIKIINEGNTYSYKYDFTTKNIDEKAFPYYTWSKISKNILYNDKRIISKTSGKGHLELRTTIANHLYDSKGINVNPSNIIIGSGIEYLFTIITDLLPCKTYAIENPGYEKIKNILVNNDKNIKYVGMDNEGVILSELENCDCVYITPENQFPTGIKTSINRRIMLAEWTKKNKYIIEDDYDSAFKYLSKSYISLYSLANEKTIYLSTFSRSISPGLRIAYMILPDDLLNIYEKKFGTYSSTVSTIDQLILNEFIKGGYYNRHLNKTKNIYIKKRDLIISILEKYDYINIDYKNSLLSIIISIDDLNTKLFKKACKDNFIDISIIEDFYFYNEKSNKIIIGYSNINIYEIKDGLDLLINIIDYSRISKKTLET